MRKTEYSNKRLLLTFVSSVQNILIPRPCGKRQADFQELTVHVVSYTLMKIPLKIQQINLLTCCGVVPVAVLYK